MSALSTGRLYLPGNIPGTRFCYRMRRPRGHGIKSIKHYYDYMGIEPATFRLVVQCLNQLRRRVPHLGCVPTPKFETFFFIHSLHKEPKLNTQFGDCVCCSSARFTSETIRTQFNCTCYRRNSKRQAGFILRHIPLVQPNNAPYNFLKIVLYKAKPSVHIIRS
jgi:hypothetical protein